MDKAGVYPIKDLTGKYKPQMLYRHYKGGIYEIICEAKLESDPSVVMMVYKSGDGAIWTRPRGVFFELVEFEGKTVQRFAPLE